jgi:putative DNA primase/helicase
MTLPPPKVCRRIAKLHALALGSDQEGERAAAHKKLAELLAEHGRTWNDIPEILAAIRNAPPPPPPSPDPAGNQPGPEVDVYELVHRIITDHVSITPAERVATTLWILHAQVFDRFTITPRLAIMSPVRSCGKTTLLALIELLVNEPFRSDDVTPAAIYRRLERSPYTCLLIDEGDNADLVHDIKLRRVFNSGHRKGGNTSRVASGWSTQFNTFAPLAIAAIGTLPLPLLSRAIVINMQRRGPGETLEQLDEDSPIYPAAREQMRRWGSLCQLDRFPDMPPELLNRHGDNWRVLFSIADDLGHGEEARAAALELFARRTDEDAGVVLLNDVWTIFQRLGVDRITSGELIRELLALNELWSDWCDDRPGRKLNQAFLARLLRPFGIWSKSIWPQQRTPDSRSRKGYTRDQFESAWHSYCSGGTPAQPSKTMRLVER